MANQTGKIVLIVLVTIYSTVLFVHYFQPTVVIEREGASRLIFRNAPEPKNVYDYSSNAKIAKVFSDWRHCFTKKLGNDVNNPEKLWENLSGAINECAKNTELNKIKYEGVRNKDEVKYHVFSNRSSEPTNVITLGIGWDTKAEEALKTKLPKDSRFFGADPIVKTNDDLYRKVGTFFPFAVGKETGVSKAFVMPEKLHGNYEYQTMVHIDIGFFITKLVRQTFIDQLLMDNEGPEYDLLPMMGPGREFDNDGIVVCQINTELHAGTPENFKERLVSVIQQIIDDKRYVLVTASRPGHIRTFLLNMDNQRCVEKYFSQFYV